MATTDNAIKFDIALVDHLINSLGYSDEGQRWLKQFAADGLIQRDRLAEVAIAKVGSLNIVSIHGQDFCDGSDAKTATSVWRKTHNARGRWMHSFKISHTATKTGTLRIVAYNQHHNEYYYFAIPYHEYCHLRVLEIIIESYSGYHNEEPELRGPQRHLKWWKYECKTFDEMACKQFD